ncbi:hypothetical protein O5D80_003993 [Batrachochytrium dendrobatidis]|nr:hypothetical protein O5D80_003993 [Batrachochytrium dendrobatidis]
MQFGYWLTIKTVTRIEKLATVCDGSIAQASCELRWLTEAIVRRRLGSFSSRRQAAGIHHKLHCPAARQSVSQVLNELSSPSVIDSPAAVEQVVLSRLSSIEQLRLDRWIHDRCIAHKPLQYILGTQPFCGLDISVRRPTLIPRWETEEWTLSLADRIHAKTANQQLPKPLRILELCSGSGCISLALSKKLGIHAHIVGVDISLSAILLARFNQRKLMIGCVGNGSSQQLFFDQGDLFDNEFVGRLLSQMSSRLPNLVDPRFDMIISNPPYISPTEYDSLDSSVKMWEDQRALLASDEHGIRFYRRIEELADDLLLPLSHACQQYGLPRIVFEIGNTQGSAVKSQLGNRQWRRTDLVQDMAGHDRVILKY